MSETTMAIVAGFRETADRLLRGGAVSRGESIGLAITAAYVKTGIMLGMIDGVTLDYVVRVEAALHLLDEPHVEEAKSWN